MTRHENLTRMGYCESCCKPLFVRRDEAWHMTFVECRNTRCWRGIVEQISDLEVAKMDQAERAQLAARLAHLQGGA